MKKIAILDTSWFLHMNKQALSSLTLQKINNQGHPWILPTGHVHGTLSGIAQLYFQYDMVILAIDSKNKRRNGLLPSFKSGRHVKTGDAATDYNIYRDLTPLIQIATSLPNVYYIKEDEFEADDIIASWILSAKSLKDVELHCFFNDKDIFQSIGDYTWHTGIVTRDKDKRPIEFADRVAYADKQLQCEKQNDGVSFGIDHLPIWYQTVKGKGSNAIPPALLRFPSKVLIYICKELANTYKFDLFIKLLESDEVKSQLSKTWIERLYDKDGKVLKESYDALWKNHQLSYPEYKFATDFELKKLEIDDEEMYKKFAYYELSQFRSWYQKVKSQL